MKISDIITILDQMAPQTYSEDFDNVGLLVGNKFNAVTGILVCHDALEEVIMEAVEKKCNLIVCFHPIIFSGLKKITGKNHVERAVIAAIKKDVAIYAVHTSLDNHQEGVNKIFANAIGLKNTKILLPKTHTICKLVTYAPAEIAPKIKEALFAVGAGSIGEYESCSFLSTGIGSFKGTDNANPVIGNKLEYVELEEIKIEVLFQKHLQNNVLQTLFSTHIYEEVAYEIYTLENKNQIIGIGMIGELEQEQDEIPFLNFVKEKMQCEAIRHSKLLNKPIKKVAVLGGAGSFAILDAIKAGADVFLTADLKYHQFYEANNEIVVGDVGHFESERYTKNYIVDYLTKKITNFAIILSEINTNPVKYL